MSTVRFTKVNKIYDNNVQAVFDFDLDVQDKEFVVLVGPSGCGKSTTLRMLAGLEDITSGEIAIDGQVINDVLPKNRDIAMVFQNYALYPHMTVYDNMAFALKMKHLSKEEIDTRVKEAAKILALEQYLKRTPQALSGGQRQRVALGRAIVRTPKVFLMDEPLSNLDAKLRVQMRSEITRIHKKANATTIYVTHDQTEAMTMADRIVIMKDGYIQQIGSPKEVYDHPSNMFVGGFIGSPAMNFLNCRYEEGKAKIIGMGKEDEPFVLNKSQEELLQQYRKVKLEDLSEMIGKIGTMEENLKTALEEGSIAVSSPDGQEGKSKKLSKGDRADIQARIEKLGAMKTHYEEEVKEFENNAFDFVLGIRPEDLLLESAEDAQKFSIHIELSELLGHELILYTDIAGQRINIKTLAKNETKADDKIEVSFDPEKVHFFDVDTQKAIKF